MNLIDCFIDEHNNVWRARSLIEASEYLPIIKFDVEGIDFDITMRWKLVNVRDYINHFGRVLNADIRKPLILRADGFCMNGWHRIMKAIYNNIEYLPAKKFVNNPDPDFKLEYKKEEC